MGKISYLIDKHIKKLGIKECFSYQGLYDIFQDKMGHSKADSLMHSLLDNGTNYERMYSEYDIAMIFAGSFDYHYLNTVYEWIYENQDLFGETVLEVGCGCGFLTTFLSAILPKSKIVSIDIRDTAVSIAEKNVKKFNCRNVELIHGGLDSLNGRQFDTVFSARTMLESGKDTDIMKGPEAGFAACAESLSEGLGLYAKELSRLLKVKGNLLDIEPVCRWEPTYYACLKVLHENNLLLDENYSAEFNVKAIEETQTCQIGVFKKESTPQIYKIDDYIDSIAHRMNTESDYYQGWEAQMMFDYLAGEKIAGSEITNEQGRCEKKILLYRDKKDDSKIVYFTYDDKTTAAFLYIYNADQMEKLKAEIEKTQRRSSDNLGNQQVHLEYNMFYYSLGQHTENMLPFFYYLVATNPKLMKAIDAKYEKFPEIYDKAFEESHEKNPVLGKTTLENEILLRRVIGFTTVEGLDALVKIINEKHPMAEKYRKGSSYAEYAKAILKTNPLTDYRSSTEALMIYLLNNPFYLDNPEEMDYKAASICESIVWDLIGKQPEWGSEKSRKLTKATIDAIFPGNYLKYCNKMGARDLEDLIESCMVQCGLWSLDFMDEPITKQELYDALLAGFYMNEDEVSEKFEEFFAEENETALDEAGLRKAFEYAIIWLTIGHIWKMYSKAKNTALTEFDNKKQSGIREKKESIEIVEQLRGQVDQKQAIINELQLKLDKLQIKNADMAAEHEQLKMDYKNLDNEPFIMLSTEDVKEEESYPDGTVAIGGQPKWQKAFLSRHPNVKIMDGFDHNLNIDGINSKVPLVLFNVSGMSHSTYYRVCAAIKKYKIAIKYIQ